MLDDDAADVQDVDVVDVGEVGFQVELVEVQGDFEAGVLGAQVGGAHQDDGVFGFGTFGHMVRRSGEYGWTGGLDLQVYLFPHAERDVMRY